MRRFKQFCLFHTETNFPKGTFLFCRPIRAFPQQRVRLQRVPSFLWAWGSKFDGRYRTIRSYALWSAKPWRSLCKIFFYIFLHVSLFWKYRDFFSRNGSAVLHFKTKTFVSIPYFSWLGTKTKGCCFSAVQIYALCKLTQFFWCLLREPWNCKEIDTISPKGSEL